MLRPSESLTVRLQMYVEVHARYRMGSLARLHLHVWCGLCVVLVDVVHAPRRRRKSLNKRELS